MPKVSIIMPVYNCEKYVGEAIDSILNQTFQDFELIVINDCSKDKSREEILNRHDDRIVFIDNEENHGFLYGLNYGISISKGEYIARLDDDDISYPSRLEKQVKYMDDNRDVALLGTWMDLLIEDKRVCQPLPPINTPEQIKFSLLFGNFCIGHSTFMIRRKVLEENGIQYETYKQTPDMYMQSVIALHGKLDYLKEPLVAWRIHSNQSTQLRSTEMKMNEADRCQIKYLNSLMLDEIYSRVLKHGILRKIRTQKEVMEFADAFEQVATICGIGDTMSDKLCKQFIFSKVMYNQYRCIGLGLGVWRVRKFLSPDICKKLLFKCCFYRNKNYIMTTVDEE